MSCEVVLEYDAALSNISTRTWGLRQERSFVSMLDDTEA